MVAKCRNNYYYDLYQVVSEIPGHLPQQCQEREVTLPDRPPRRGAFPVRRAPPRGGGQGEGSDVLSLLSYTLRYVSLEDVDRLIQVDDN